jgi:hypothetical protein
MGLVKHRFYLYNLVNPPKGHHEYLKDLFHHHNRIIRIFTNRSEFFC